jgi:hypothetical protein
MIVEASLHDLGIDIHCLFENLLPTLVAACPTTASLYCFNSSFVAFDGFLPLSSLESSVTEISSSFEASDGKGGGLENF